LTAASGVGTITNNSDGRQPVKTQGLIAGVTAELRKSARRDGYLRDTLWDTADRRLAAHLVAAADRAGVRADLARIASRDGWVSPDEALPADTRERLPLLAAKARGQAKRASVITEGYFAALLALGRAWGLPQEEVAWEVARCCVAEHWTVDWELACDMEELLGAERVAERRRSARGAAQAEMVRRGDKGWLNETDEVALYECLRERGATDTEARTLLASLRLESDERRLVWAGSTDLASPLPSDARLRLTLDKVARQATRRHVVGEGFRQALFDEAAATNIDPVTLQNAIVERRERERWPAVFDPCWQLEPLAPMGPRPWWQQLLSDLSYVTDQALAASGLAWLRPVASSGLRVGAPILLLGAGLTLGRPVPTPSLPTPTLTMAAAAPAVAAPIAAPVATPAPAPPSVQTLVVAHTDGVGARLRTAPVSGPVARLLGEGTAVIVIGSEIQVDGAGWTQVRAPDGTSGWMAAALLEGSAGEPGSIG
jgi:hypothetical protein